MCCCSQHNDETNDVLDDIPRLVNVSYCITEHFVTALDECTLLPGVLVIVALTHVSYLLY